MKIKRLLAAVLITAVSAALLAGCNNSDKQIQTLERTTENTELTSPSSEPDTNESTLEQNSTGKGTVTSRVNFRAAADSGSESFGILETGTGIEIISVGEVWCQVEYDGKTGYIASQYIEIDTMPDLPDESSSNDTTQNTTIADAEPTTAEPASESDEGFDGAIVRNNTVWDPSTLSNSSIPYGNDWEDKNALGVPNGVYYYESLYSKYNAVYHVETEQKIIYLTMDEGYEAGYTPVILDILKEKGVKATFFLTKQFVDSDPELVQRMIDEGHTLGNHTCLHPSGGFPKYIDEHGFQSFIDDVNRLHDIVLNQFGYDLKLFRFPEGESSEMTMAQLSNMGYTSVFWSYAHRDFVLDDQPEVSVTLERCISHLHPGAVYLLHAVSESNTYALADFIDAAYAQGYTFSLLPIE